jgi:uncharacterized membrane protein HdeD (DUF308 family)
MATAHAHAGLPGSESIRRFGGWFIAIGILFIILGAFAIVEPGVAGLAVALLVGWLLIFAGGVHLVSTFRGGGAGRVIWHVGGVYFLTHPLLGLGTLTLFLAGIFLAGAVLEFLAYFRRKGEAGSTWMLVNSVITLLLGGLIWLHWPSSSVWAIGTLVGVSLIMTGFSRLMLGVAARKLATRVAV